MSAHTAICSFTSSLSPTVCFSRILCSWPHPTPFGGAQERCQDDLPSGRQLVPVSTAAASHFIQPHTRLLQTSPRTQALDKCRWKLDLAPLSFGTTAAQQIVGPARKQSSWPTRMCPASSVDVPQSRRAHRGLKEFNLHGVRSPSADSHRAKPCTFLCGSSSIIVLKNI